MRRFRHLTIITLFGMIGFGAPVLAQEVAPGANVDSLLAYAKSRNPEFAAMQAEAEASAERVVPAGALPDPKFRTELRDITRFGEQSATLSPSRVGSTRYLLMQDIPWFGKRDLQREIAELEAELADIESKLQVEEGRGRVGRTAASGQEGRVRHGRSSVAGCARPRSPTCRRRNSCAISFRARTGSSSTRRGASG